MRRITLMLIVLVLLALGVVNVSATSADLDSNNVYWWWGEMAGSSTIVRSDSGISGTYSSSLSNDVGSMNGYAVTVWFVVFNEPEQCGDPLDPFDQCIDTDLFNPLVKADVLYAAGNIVGGSENANFGLHLNEGDNSGSIADLFGLPTNNGESWGLIDARKAEVHYVLRTHGPKVPGHVKGMIQTYEGGCVFNAPYGYNPPMAENQLQLDLGDCQDVQFAVNPAP